MRRSLRVRVTLLVAMILLVTLGAVGLVFVTVARVEVARFLVPEADKAGIALARDAVERIEASGRDGLQDWLHEQAARSTGRIVVLSGDRVEATTEPPLAGGRVATLPNGTVRIESGGVVLLLRSPTMTVPRSAGRTYRVYALPASERMPQREDLIQPLQRWAAVLVSAGALVGIVLAIAVVRRVTGPLEELTRAVRRMEGGDLSVRVTAGEGDEVAQLADAFNALADRLERVEELRRNMVSDVAHELRAPVTNVRCEIESMQDGVRPIDRERIDSIHGEILALGELVDDLQELAIADAGQLRLAPARFSLTELMRGMTRRFESTAASRGVSIVLGGGEVAVLADERRMTQVVRNLVGNAIAHSPNGGTVRVSVSGDERVAAVRVADEGPGVAPEERDLVFERFYRADPSRARATGGAGLGLAIAKMIVEAHGGRIGVDVSGGGAEFWFEIPAGARDGWSAPNT